MTSRPGAWSRAPIFVKGFLVVLLPIVVLSLTSASVYLTSKAHRQSEQQREAAESVSAAVTHLDAILAKAGTTYEMAVRTGAPAPTADFAALTVEWRGAVEALAAAANAQPDAALRADARKVQLASDDLYAVMVEWARSASGPDLPLALQERAARSVEMASASTKAASLRAERLTEIYTQRHERLSVWLDRLTVFGTPLGTVAAVFGMVMFARSLVQRIRRLEGNASALGEGHPLASLDHAGDELGRLGRGLDRAALLLREREAATRRSEQQLAIALEAGAMGVWTANLVTGSSEWSPRCELVHGMAPGSFGGTFEAWIGIVHPDDRANVLAANSGALANGGRWSASYRTTAADGTTRWIEIHSQTVADETGKIVGLIGIATDVTDRRFGEIALRDAMAEAERSNSAKSEFLSRVSHELRTPLNAILGFGQLLEMEDLTEDQDESVAQVLRGGRHLLAVIDDVLDVSRIDSGMLSLSVEPVGLVELLDETMSLINPMAVAHGVRLEAVSSGEGLHVLADRRRLKQVIINLASNAIKFNHPGGVVTFRCAAADGGLVRLDVVDTGPGIGEDLLDRLFTPFDRLGAEQTSVEGTGIGLALSQRLVQALGGTISVTTRIGHGSTFSVDLPRAETPGSELADAVEELLTAEAAGVGGVVLYIEDNPSNLRLVQRVFDRRPDVQLLVAQTGELGLSIASRVKVDVVLLDLHLPDVGGEQVLRRLRESESTASTPIVVVSADATEGQIERLRDAGATDYLTKPLDVRQFVRVVDDLLAGART